MGKAKKNLVIVESPSKAKTIGKFLGTKYKVIASAGHVRDLPKSKLGIDTENNYEISYISIRGKGDLIRELKKEAKNAEKIYLATDPDREGEAISWHLAYILGIDEKASCRIVFNEITKKAVTNAVKNPRPIDLKLVNSQQARRVVDRLVGYKISPLLWSKIRWGLSAGRVQSAALKILCDREKQIKDFVPKEFWNISVTLSKANDAKAKEFTAKLAEYKGKKITVESKVQADGILAGLDKDGYIVQSTEAKQKSKKSYAPFTTATLQQDASTKLNFFTKRTMSVAQQLYEGVNVKGHGTVGLVTYIRTDSVRISEEARFAAKDFIFENYGEKYWGNNYHTNKKKEVADAHEAIRPSHIEFTPEMVKESLTSDQFKLYRLIWLRFMASQMSPAVYDMITAEIKNKDCLFRASGSKLVFDGHLKLYNSANDEDKDKMLPDLNPDERLKCINLSAEQSFTQPPPRFTEASLVKDLEEKNIGRPSTYASIISTLLERKYASREKKSLIPTDLGFIVTEVMEEYFKQIVDVSFTADMEDKLDQIEIENSDWKAVVNEFYKPLKEELEIAEEKIEKVKFEDEITGDICELCGKPMAKKHGRFGEFLACTGYPDCKNTKPILNAIEVKCPQCSKPIVARKGRTGKLFYGCSGYPECTQSYWNKPIEKQCPKCGALLVEKKLKGSNFSCSNSECDYKE